MIVFLAPLALFGLGLLSVPILVHLFKPRKVKVVPFTSLRWLRSSQHRLSRRVRWHQIILFLLRAAFIILLVMALARPIFSPSRGQGKAERFIILDTSRSMQYENSDGTISFAAARGLAERLLLSGLAGDRSTVLLAGNNAEPLGPLRDDPAGYVGRLRATRPSDGEGDLTGALQFIPALLAPGRAGTAVELFFITANLAGSWTQSGIARFLGEVAAPVRVHVFDLGPDHPRNAWIARAELIKSDNPFPRDAGQVQRLIRVQVAAIGDSIRERTVRLAHIAGMPELTRKVSLKPGPPLQVEFELPAALDLKGQVASLSLEPSDALASDDQYWVNLDWRGYIRVLVIENESTQIPELQPGFHLRTALEALAYADPGALQFVRRSDTAVKPEDIAEANVIMMADVPALADERLEQLEDRVKAGAGLVVFLGPSIRNDFYESKLFNPVRASTSLLAARLGKLVDLQKSRGDLAIFGDVQWNHPLLAPLYDPTFNDLPQIRFRTYYLLTPVEGRNDVHVIATIQGQTPAILESSTGAGRILLFNTTASDAWSDLPRRKGFVPLMDRVLQYLAGGLWRGRFEVGEAVNLPLPDALTNNAVVITTPDGQSLRPEIRMIAGRAVMQLPAIQKAGVYQVAYMRASGMERLPFIVQALRRDSPLLPADKGILQRWWQSAEFEVTTPDLGPRHGLATEKRVALDQLLMILALLVFLAEMWLTHKYCPTAHPRVVLSSVVARAGFFGGRKE
ncbi:MAG: BatA domain-containing protein [Lentisphaerae bacterium]|nr:BatA domain-containing protein [Lentisphaerota bacterium]